MTPVVAFMRHVTLWPLKCKRLDHRTTVTEPLLEFLNELGSKTVSRNAHVLHRRMTNTKHEVAASERD